MIRFFHSSYTSKELEYLRDMIHVLNKNVVCDDDGCDNCVIKNVCNDMLQFERRLEHLAIMRKQEER